VQLNTSRAASQIRTRVRDFLALRSDSTFQEGVNLIGHQDHSQDMMYDEITASLIVKQWNVCISLIAWGENPTGIGENDELTDKCNLLYKH